MSWLLLGRRGNPALTELHRALLDRGVDVRAVARHPLLGWRLGEQPKLVLFSYPEQASLLPRLKRARKAYYVQDDFRAYGYPPARLERWEDALLAEADLLVVVSEALATRYRERYQGPILVSPLAVPDRFLPAACPPAREPRLLVGILGRISSRLRLGWLRGAVTRLGWLRLVLVGDVEPSELLPEDRPDLRFLGRNERCLFVGWRPFPRLFDYAACLDAALLPYSARSVNPCGSAYRFFVHLPFGAPMLATPGVAQLEEFAPLVSLCQSEDELIHRLEELRQARFEDGLRRERWEAARRHTWSRRAETLLEAL